MVPMQHALSVEQLMADLRPRLVKWAEEVGFNDGN